MNPRPPFAYVEDGSLYLARQVVPLQEKVDPNYMADEINKELAAWLAGAKVERDWRPKLGDGK